ncbi:MAG: hypothetical protein ACKO16_05020 [Gemmataceae bacterium]
MSQTNDDSRTWIVGMDEAGYGPNLGPFVMAGVIANWKAEGDWVESFKNLCRSASNKKDITRPLVDDSKKAYSKEGVEGLERTVASFFELGQNMGQCLNEKSVHGLEHLIHEPWFKPEENTFFPGLDPEALYSTNSRNFASIGFESFDCRFFILPSLVFNQIVEKNDNKGAVLSAGMISIFKHLENLFSSGDAIHGFVDKHGGKNNYSATLQNILNKGLILAGQEGVYESNYKSLGADQDWNFRILPKADVKFPMVGLASMLAKWMRERLMSQFNAYWAEQVPGILPTAGYPGDAPRFYDLIKEKAQALGMTREKVWRNR